MEVFNCRTIGLLCIFSVSSVTAQMRHTVSAPHYTTVNYVLMAASFIILVSLLLGVLLLLRNDFGRQVKTPRRQVIKVQPRPSEASVSGGEMIVEDLVDENWIVEPKS